MTFDVTLLPVPGDNQADDDFDPDCEDCGGWGMCDNQDTPRELVRCNCGDRMRERAEEAREEEDDQ